MGWLKKPTVVSLAAYQEIRPKSEVIQENYKRLKLRGFRQGELINLMGSSVLTVLVPTLSGKLLTIERTYQRKAGSPPILYKNMIIGREDETKHEVY